MSACCHAQCQFQDFLKNRTIYYKKNATGEEYCIFHAPKSIKEKFIYEEKKLFQKIIIEYVEQSIELGKDIDFSHVVFCEKFYFKELNATILDFDFTTLKQRCIESNVNINFTKAIFYDYFRLDNIKCKELIFKDTEFHKGGAIKNRDREDNVHIEKLVFRPFSVQSDFVIDIGQYANKEGEIETAITGTIKEIEFENHKEGSGIIYFVGLNEKTEKADFRNRILDNVSFQNCNLSNAYFLNSKIDKTELKNCEFRLEEDFLKWIFPAMVGFILLGIMLIFFEGKLSPLVVAIVLIFIVFFILFFLVMGSNKHIAVKDEKIISYRYNNSYEALYEVYRMLKENFATTDYQKSGDFFYSQRLAQLHCSVKKLDKILYFFHYLINGFGEKFLRALIMFFVLIFLFSSFYIENKDFIATDSTPSFLTNNEVVDYNSSKYYKDQKYFDSENRLVERKYVPNQLLTCIQGDKNKSSIINTCVFDRAKVRLTYSASQFISPFVLKSKAWFKTVSGKAMFLNILESILLYFFFGAFLLAIKNRIKR